MTATDNDLPKVAALLNAIRGKHRRVVAVLWEELKTKLALVDPRTLKPKRS